MNWNRCAALAQYILGSLSFALGEARYPFCQKCLSWWFKNVSVSVMCWALAASSQFRVLVPLKWGSSQGSAESLESAAGIGVSSKLISIFSCFRSLENCSSKEMSAYLRWFYSVHFRQHCQEPRELLISQVSYYFSTPSWVLLQSNYFPHLFKEYLINHHQLLGLCSLTLPLSPDFPLQCLCSFESRPAVPSYFPCDHNTSCSSKTSFR